MEDTTGPEDVQWGSTFPSWGLRPPSDWLPSGFPARSLSDCQALWGSCKATDPPGHMQVTPLPWPLVPLLHLSGPLGTSATTLQLWWGLGQGLHWRGGCVNPSPCGGTWDCSPLCLAHLGALPSKAPLPDVQPETSVLWEAWWGMQAWGLIGWLLSPPSGPKLAPHRWPRSPCGLQGHSKKVPYFYGKKGFN